MKAFIEEFILQAILSSKPAEKEEIEEKKPIIFARPEAGIMPAIPKPAAKPKEVIPIPTLVPTIIPPAVAGEFGKLSEIVEDKSIIMIECLPEQKVKIKKKVDAGEQLEEKEIVLGSEEILDIIKIFSEKASKPLEKVFRTSFQDMEISAIVSEETGNRILIKRK